MSEKIDNPELIEVFKEEAQSLIDQMRDRLSRLKKTTDRRIRKMKYWELFLCAHTLKGSSGCAGFKEIGEINRILVEIFRSAKDGELGIKPDSIPLLSEAVEACQKLLDKKEVTNFNELLERLKNLNDQGGEDHPFER